MSSSVSLHILSGEVKTHELGFMAPNSTVTYVTLNVSSEIDTGHRKGIRDQLRFAIKQLEDRRMYIYISF